MPKVGIKEKGKDDGCCGVFFLKYVIFIFNVIFWLSGGALLGVGIWTLIQKTHYVSLLASSTYIATTHIMIALGIGVIIIGCVGCCGAWRENRFCLMTYASLLLLVFLLEAVVGVLAYIHQSSIEAELTLNLQQTLLENYKFDKEKTLAIDSMHQEFLCCGANNHRDWAGSSWQALDNSTTRVPDSCCISPAEGCTMRDNKFRDHPSNIYDVGCIKSLGRYIKEHLIIIGAVGIGLCCLEIFGIIFACCLAKAIKDWEERQKNYNW